MIKYLRRTWKNKVVALSVIFIGRLSLFIDSEGTGLVFLLLLAIPLFFARHNYID